MGLIIPAYKKRIICISQYLNFPKEFLDTVFYLFLYQNILLIWRGISITEPKTGSNMVDDAKNTTVKKVLLI